ncbi:MAG: Fic family protein, partial [Hyphomicrobiales bacterium]|nr:Fic family protein [Hyphomicrobiales bacterium]
VLLGAERDAGRPLTGALIGQAVTLADSAIAVQNLCGDWNDRANAESLSPRTGTGLQALAEFQVVCANRFESLAAYTPQERSAVLEGMIQEIRDSPPDIGAAIKHRFEAYAGLKIEQFRFEQNTIGPLEYYRGDDLEFEDPNETGWKFVMDGNFHDEVLGQYHFENEAGYMRGMLRAFNHMIATVAEPLTADSYRELHDRAVDGVRESDDVGPIPRLMKLGYRDGVSVGFRVALGSNMSVAGRNEFRARPKVNDYGNDIVRDNWIVIPGIADQQDRLDTLAKSAEECRGKAQEIINQYNIDIAAAEPEDEKLNVIARCCQDLDQYHLFEDGNLRTVAFLTMNKLLIQNDFPPTTFMNPNIVDLYSIPEIVAEIRAGWMTASGW